jgi:hypothetical protein
MIIAGALGAATAVFIGTVQHAASTPRANEAGYAAAA